MSDFFDKTFAQGIIASIAVLLISIWLGGQAKPISSGKGWKIVVIVSYTMILGGLYMLGTHVQNGGLDNPYAGAGLSVAILGFCLKYVGKFFIWWHY